MSFTHKNTIKYTYHAGGVNNDKTITVSEVGEAEINLSHVVTMGGTVTADLDVPGFEFTTKAQALSVYFRLDGVNGAIYSDASSNGDKMADLDDGVPFVWSKNGGVDFPAGTANPMFDGTASLVVKPDAHHAVNNPNAEDGKSATIIVRVLYDPSA